MNYKQRYILSNGNSGISSPNVYALQKPITLQTLNDSICRLMLWKNPASNDPSI